MIYDSNPYELPGVPVFCYIGYQVIVIQERLVLPKYVSGILRIWQRVRKISGGTLRILLGVAIKFLQFQIC